MRRSHALTSLSIREQATMKKRRVHVPVVSFIEFEHQHIHASYMHTQKYITQFFLSNINVCLDSEKKMLTIKYSFS